MGTGIKRVQAVLLVLMLAILGFLGAQPAIATETEPGPGSETEQPVDPGAPTKPDVPPVVIPPILEPDPTPPPADPEITPAPIQPPVEPEPVPVVPPVPAPGSPQTVVPVAPAVPVPSQPLRVPEAPIDAGTPGYELEPAVPAETTISAPAEPTPTPSPTPEATKTAAPPVASADIAGPLKVALAPVAENNPIVQGLTVLVLILLGVVYFRALRSKGVPGPRLNGK